MPTRPDDDLDFDWAVIEQVRPEIDLPAPHWRDTFKRIAAPTLVIGGGPTSFVPQAHVAELVDLLHDGHHLTIEAGHCIHATQGERFIHAVETFLGDHGWVGPR
jgi:pimeloyl-ACP methyl ester carboxylesterase